ncbi:MAG: metallophosphoesterase family protein, partial [Gammaproteobacteria bacterium]
MKFIHAADLHIDSPLRGLDRYEGAPVDRLRAATRGALERLVALAIDESVDFVLLAGDVYDRDWPDFHTGLFFREQMLRLHHAGIRVFMVQGNHDAQGVITRSVPLPDNVHLFSSRKAECLRLDELGAAIHGRSFPDRAVDEDLVPDYPEPVAGLFNIGLLHTSLTGRAGHDNYAPTSEAVLSAKGYDYWALGHVHAREVIQETAPRIVFPGNTQGRHAREIGPKGCELVALKSGAPESRFVALDSVRWHRIDIDLTDVDGEPALERAFLDAVRPKLDSERLHALRVELSGNTALHALEAAQPGRLEALLRGAAQDLETSGDDVWIEKVKLNLSSPVNREQLAEREDALGELIRLVDT